MFACGEARLGAIRPSLFLASLLINKSSATKEKKMKQLKRVVRRRKGNRKDRDKEEEGKGERKK